MTEHSAGRGLALAAVLLVCALPRPSLAQDEYGSKGLFPVYDNGRTWFIYDKTARKGAARGLMPGSRFLVVGSRGADLFSVVRTSATYGGACSGRKPLRLRAALLRGPRETVGDPIMAIRVPESFTLKGSNALYSPLPNAVEEDLYKSLGPALAAATVEEAKTGSFRLRPDDAGAAAFLSDPQPGKILIKIDYASRPRVAGLTAPVVLITGAQISNSFRRCLRLADGERLLGSCVDMPSDLMAETALLRFVSYDPGGKGSPFLLAYTRQAPLWGHERWGFVLRAGGARLFLRDAMDPRCREGF